MISGIATALLMGMFIGLWFWAWSKRRTNDFNEAAQLPLIEPVAQRSKEDPQA